MKRVTQQDLENGLKAAGFKFVRVDARSWGDEVVKKPFSTSPKDQPWTILMVSKSTVINGDQWVFVTRWEKKDHGCAANTKPAKTLHDHLANYIFLKSNEAMKHCIIFFRNQDFYDALQEDADTVSRLLEIRKTELKNLARWCGVPFHAIHSVRRKLDELGFESITIEN